MLLTLSVWAMVTAVAGFVGISLLRCRTTRYVPTVPGCSVALSTSAVFPPASDETKQQLGSNSCDETGLVSGPPSGYCTPVLTRLLFSSLKTGRPRPVA